MVLAASPAAIQAVSVFQRRDGDHPHGGGGGGGGHGHAAAAPSSGYSEPSGGYSAPSTGYSEPSSSYGGGGHTGYGGYEPALPDLTPIIVGILVLTGLSLLFPTYVSLTTVRRKREAGEEGKTRGGSRKEEDEDWGVIWTKKPNTTSKSPKSPNTHTYTHTNHHNTTHTCT